jgi:hypothetical protein
VAFFKFEALFRELTIRAPLGKQLRKRNRGPFAHQGPAGDKHLFSRQIKISGGAFRGAERAAVRTAKINEL